MISQATRALTRSCQILGQLPTNGQVPSVLAVQKRFKDTKAKKRCPEEKPKKTKKLVPALTIAAVGTTVAIIAAKNDDEFREWAKENLPALDNLVKIIYEEEETYPEFIVRSYKDLTEWIKQFLYDSFRGTKKLPEAKKEGGPIKEVFEESKKPYKPPESAFMVEEEKKEVTDSASKSVQSVPRYIKELKDIEDKLGHSAQDIIQAYHAVVFCLKEQANYIDNLDLLISKHDCKVWDKLDKKMKDKQKFLSKAESETRSLEITSEKLKSRLENDSNLTDEMKDKARSNLVVLMKDINKAKENMEKEMAKSTLAKRSWDKARHARMHFSEELETLFPNVWLNDEKLELPLDSLGPFIEHIVDNILYLDKELSKLQTVKDAETTSGIERFKSTHDPEGLIYASVCLEVGKVKRTEHSAMQKTLLTHQAKCEKNARAMMKQQTEVYKDLKAEALSMKEREVERKMQQVLEEKLATIRAEHKVEVAKLVGRIQGANEAIAQRGDKDKGQQERQQFWSAAQSFVSAVNPIGVSTKQKDPKPLKNEVTNVSKSAPEKDELVESVIESIPRQALERGVECEERLKERFMTLEQEARKVAAVPEGEVTLLQLFLARLQSALYINEPIPQKELNNEPFEPELLNNYEILYRARYYVDKGEFDQAVRYLNLLQGPCMKVASDWVRDVLVFLETRQAAETLMAHASAACLQN